MLKEERKIPVLFSLISEKNLLPRAKKTCVYSKATLYVFTFG